MANNNIYTTPALSLALLIASNVRDHKGGGGSGYHGAPRPRAESINYQFIIDKVQATTLTEITLNLGSISKTDLHKIFKAIPKTVTNVSITGRFYSLKIHEWAIILTDLQNSALQIHADETTIAKINQARIEIER